MAGEVGREIFRDHHLLDRARAAVGFALERHEPAHHLPIGHHVAEPQRRRQRFGERADVDHLLRVERVERRRRIGVPQEIRVALVFEHRHAVLARERKQRAPALERQGRAGRILDSRNRVDEFRHDAVAPQVFENVGERVDAQAFAVEGHRHDVRAQPAQLGQRALIGKLFHQHRVARFDQEPVDEVEPLAGARRDQHVVRRTLDAGTPGDLGHHEVTQPAETLRSVGIVKGEVGAAALEHRRCGIGERGGRNAGRIVVTADEVVFRKSGPARCRRRQFARKTSGVGKTRSGHVRWSL